MGFEALWKVWKEKELDFFIVEGLEMNWLKHHEEV